MISPSFAGIPLPIGRFSIVLPLSLIVAGCVGTTFTAPQADVAPSFAVSAPARSANGAWWLNFRDSHLDGLITQGLTRNLSLETAVAAIDEAGAGVRLARAANLPTLQVGAGAQRADMQGAGITESTQASLSTSWMFDIFGGSSASRAAAISELEAAKLSAEAARRAVTSAITGAYIDLRFYQESIELTRQSIASRRETLQLTQSMKELGRANRLDVLQA
jgi:multidrug efflux system outer membrane protein